MSESKWACGCYEHDGKLTPCVPDRDHPCFRLRALEDIKSEPKADEPKAKGKKPIPFGQVKQ